VESKDSPWTLERAMIISKTEGQSASITTNTGIWPKNARRRKRRKLGNISNMTKKGI